MRLIQRCFLLLCSARVKTQHYITGILIGYFCVLMHIPIFNLGGSDAVNFPQNTLAWIVVTVIIFGASHFLPGQRNRLTTTFWFLLAGVCLFTIPVFWCPTIVWVKQAIPRLLGLWGGVVFYYVLLQCRLTDRNKQILLWCITFSAIWEGVNVITGIFDPGMLSALSQKFLTVNGRGALGIFQQVNVTASYLATGLALCFALYVRIRQTHRLCNSVKKLYLLAGIFFLSGVIVLTHSRIGWIGGGIVFSGFVIASAFSTKVQRFHIFLKHYSAPVIVSLAGVLIGIFLLDCPITQAISHSASNHQRWLTLKVTWEMIQMHPWQGWGLGSFRMQFQHFLSSTYHPNPSRELMGHPHNELLYVWFEGGIVALCGFLLLVGAVINLLRRNMSFPDLLIWMALLPVLLHTLVEFPLYYSVAHVLTLLVILLNIDRPTGQISDAGIHTDPALNSHAERRVMAILISAITAFISVCITVWLLCTMHAGFILSHYEEQTLTTPTDIRYVYVPGLLSSRYEYDLITLNLVDFWYSNDNAYLEHFLVQNAAWLQFNIASDSYINQIDVLRYLRRYKEACRYVELAHDLFPNDKRFMNNASISCDGFNIG